MLSFGERLKQARENKGLTQAQVSKLVHISDKSLSRYETGASSPDPDTILKLATLFNVSTDYLLGNDNNAITHHFSKKGIKIPVLGRVQAGIPVEAVQEVLDYEEITEEMAATGDFFALYVRGHSMEPTFCEGDVVVVRQQSTADSGDIVVALVNGDDATIKKFKQTPNGIALIPINDAFDTLFYSPKQIEELPVRIIGKVVELRRKF